MLRLYIIFVCRFAWKMKIAVAMIIAAVVLSSSVIPAQDVDDASAPLQGNTDVKKQEHQSESDDSSASESVDRLGDDKPSLEIDIFGDVETFPVEFEGEVTDHEPTVDFLDPDDLDSEDGDMPAPEEQQMAEFPPPFDQSMIDSSNVAQVAISTVNRHKLHVTLL